MVNKMENIWIKYNTEEKKQIANLAESYKKFISNCKTERECVKEIISQAKRCGFVDLKEKKTSLKPGDKIYFNNMNKNVSLFVIGSESLDNGFRIIASHIDSPRIDLKPKPIYEKNDLVYFNTHYYGGIKNYQWLNIPLAIHGLIIKNDGTMLELNIGEKDNDPVFSITDLLPHLAKEQLEKEANKFIDSENLDLLISSMPNQESVKSNLLKIIKKQYNIDEKDFLSAEIEIVPAFKARDLGFDRSMIIGYGHDDRSCAYSSLQAILNIKNPTRTCACLFVDKEEIGSVGATGMHSKFFYNCVCEIMSLIPNNSLVKINRALANSQVLSSDVNAAFDPLYDEVMDHDNSSYLNRGLALNKYTGSKGKSNASDANCEYVVRIRDIFEKNNVSYQLSELGKVDIGGGGTIAYILANYNMEVIDCGIPVLSMHAPYEIISKADLYEAYKGYFVFYNNINCYFT